MTDTRPSSPILPLTVRVPLLVALLVILVALVISHTVLQRLEQQHEATLREVANTYLAALSVSLLPSVRRGDIWETFDTLDRSRKPDGDVRITQAIVTDPDGIVIAASDPRQVPTNHQIPDDLADLPLAGPATDADARGTVWMQRTLIDGGRDIGRLHAELDIRALIAERDGVTVTLITVNAILAALFALLGYALVRWLLRPMSALQTRIAQVADGDLSPFPDGALPLKDSEFGRVFRQFNRMTEALQEREALAVRLAEEEKFGLIGRLASSLAHEVNNPLGGMLNTVATLRRHGRRPEVLEQSIDILQQGLDAISSVVGGILKTYDRGNTRRPLARADLEGLRALLGARIGRRAIAMDWRIDLAGPVDVPEGPVRQIVLNLVLNAIEAAPRDSRIALSATLSDGSLLIAVEDSGPPIPDDMLSLLCAPAAHPVPPPGRRGLGLWVVSRLVGELNGHVRIEERFGGKTVVVALPVQPTTALEQEIGHVA